MNNIIYEGQIYVITPCYNMRLYYQDFFEKPFLNDILKLLYKKTRKR